MTKHGAIFFVTFEELQDRGVDPYAQRSLQQWSELLHQHGEGALPTESTLMAAWLDHEDDTVCFKVHHENLDEVDEGCLYERMPLWHAEPWDNKMCASAALGLEHGYDYGMHIDYPQRLFYEAMALSSGAITQRAPTMEECRDAAQKAAEAMAQPFGTAAERIETGDAVAVVFDKGSTIVKRAGIVAGLQPLVSHKFCSGDFVRPIGITNADDYCVVDTVRNGVGQLLYRCRVRGSSYVGEFSEDKLQLVKHTTASESDCKCLDLLNGHANTCSFYKP